MYFHNSSPKRHTRGVTLIELLVVITIMMSMLALVSPLAINTVDKAEAQREYLSFCSLLRNASMKAFANGSYINIRLQGNHLVASYNKSFYFNDDTSALNQLPEQQTLNRQDTANIIVLEYENTALITDKTYKYLHFPTTLIALNKNGLPDLKTIKFTQRNRQRELNLLSLFNK